MQVEILTDLTSRTQTGTGWGRESVSAGMWLQDAMEVESIGGDADASPKMSKQLSNDSLELLEAKAHDLDAGLLQASRPRLRETASSFEPPALGVPVPRLVPKAGHGIRMTHDTDLGPNCMPSPRVPVTVEPAHQLL